MLSSTAKVIIEDGVKIMEKAVIRGPAYIGRIPLSATMPWSEAYSHLGSDWWGRF